TNTTLDKAAQINGFSGAAKDNEDWLISPLMNLTEFNDFPMLSFWTISAFAGDQLQLKYSTNYIDNEDPSLATWTDLNGKFPASNSAKWTQSSTILPKENNIRIAFVYTSNTSAASRWTIDDWQVQDVSCYLDVPDFAFTFGEVRQGENSAANSFMFSAAGYADLTLKAAEGFQISNDNISFASTLVVSEANAISGKTIYCRLLPFEKRLQWSGGITFKGTGLSSIKKGSMSGSSYFKSETFDIATYNLEFFGTDVKDTDGSEFGPSNDALQVSNVTEVLSSIGADIFAIEEIADDNAFNLLVSNLPGYDKIISDRWSYSFDEPDPNFPPQKIGFIYNTSTVELINSRVIFAEMYDAIQANTFALPSYPSGSSSFWSSGRLPFIATFDVTIRGAKQRLHVIDIHAKSGSTLADYNRRKYDVNVLRDSLNTHYAGSNIILLGDFNDDVDESISEGAESSYTSFVNDIYNFNTLTYSLSQNGASSFPNSSSFLDHIIVSNELTDSYIENSIQVEDARIFISNYMNTTSDHLPVSARFLFKADQIITFDALPNKMYGDDAFAMTATSNSDLRVSFTSSDPSILSIDERIATIHGIGTVLITASQEGDNVTNPAAAVVQSLVVNKALQSVLFESVSEKKEAEESFLLNASSTSGLEINFNSSSDKISIDGNLVNIIKPGRVVVSANQNGDSFYSSAPPVTQSFCINPIKPAISTSSSNAGIAILTSSSFIGNQWYLNGSLIEGESKESVKAFASGVYTVRVKIDDCLSEFSHDEVVFIMGDLSDHSQMVFYPNPADEYLIISGLADDVPQFEIIDMIGRNYSVKSESQNSKDYKIDISDLDRGLYLMRVRAQSGVSLIRFVKQ
ncbi:MAG TPA: choice-of-anchor J domain-containing protein, partial [Cyclobacteriaceae bacterium]